MYKMLDSFVGREFHSYLLESEMKELGYKKLSLIKYYNPTTKHKIEFYSHQTHKARKYEGYIVATAKFKITGYRTIK